MIPKDLETLIREKLLDMPGSSFRTLSAVIKAPRSSVWDAPLRMQKSGAVTRRGTGKSVTYTTNTVIKKPREYKAKEPLRVPNVRPIESSISRTKRTRCTNRQMPVLRNHDALQRAMETLHMPQPHVL